jgi:hypothetical protein
MRRAAAAMLGLALAGGLTAGLQPASSTAARTRRTATVSGYVEYCGGPAPGRCYKGNVGFCQPPQGCVTTHRVAAVNMRGRRVATQRLYRGRFKLHLTPGLYTIQLLGDGKRVHGRVMQSRKVTARAGRTAAVRFFFSVP